MAWSWSHTAEAYDNARRNVERMPVEQLREVYAEWRAYRPELEATHADGFVQHLYNSALIQCEETPADVLAAAVWERAEDLATCDNGGSNAWVCPYGCHTVPFDTPDIEES